jgi:hypothetical protein
LACRPRPNTSREAVSPMYSWPPNAFPRPTATRRLRRADTRVRPRKHVPKRMGYYLLVIVTGGGIPSIARRIRLF